MASLLIIMLLIILIFITFSNQYKVKEGTGEAFNGYWQGEKYQVTMVAEGGSMCPHEANQLKLSDINEIHISYY